MSDSPWPPPEDELSALLDGELDEDQASRVRERLAGDEAAQDELHELIQLALLADEPASTHAASSDEADPSSPGPVVSLSSRRPRLTLALTIVGTLAAAAALLLLMRAPPKPASDAVEDDSVVALQDTRRLEPRLSHPTLDRHRPYAPLRSGETSHESISLAELAEVEASGRKDLLAGLLVLTGELERAEAQLDSLGDSADASNDRGVVSLLEHDPARALAWFDEALARDPDHLPARWNRALALRELELPLAAAAELEAVAAAEEPGWSTEASERAQALREGALARREGQGAVDEAGRSMMVGGPPIAPDLAREYPDQSRLFLYDAIRSAPSPERVAELEPLAEQLDGLQGGRHLHDLIERVTSADFQRRAPLARAYGALVAGGVRRGPNPEAERLLAEARAAEQDDIVLGLLYWLARIPDAQPEYLERAAGDPWFEQLAAWSVGSAQLERVELELAVSVLDQARERCRDGRFAFRCSLVERSLSEALAQLRRLPEAERIALAGFARARAAGLWTQEGDILAVLVLIARYRGDVTKTRAYLEESMQRLPEEPRLRCEFEAYALETMAMVSVEVLEPERALAELRRIPECGEGPAPLQTAMMLADIARMTGETPRAEEALEIVAEHRKHDLTAGDLAFALHIQGRAQLVLDRAAGEATLHQSLSTARTEGASDPLGAMSAAFSHYLLVLEAGAAGEHDEVLRRSAEALGVVPPERCALAATVVLERATVVALDDRGVAHGSFEGARRSPGFEVERLVPPAMIDSLSACEQVDVLALPPVSGRAGLLPPEIAWSYRVGPERDPPPTHASPQRLVVADVEAPEALGLPHLRPWRPEPGDGVTTLLGTEATPSRVLAAIPSADEIELHVHGLVDLTLSDTSHLVLSPDADGRHALTAGAIRSLTLPRSPLVVLGACHAGHVAPFLHEPWSLPLAFLEAGARAVIASPAVVDDAEAYAFFEAVLRLIHDGLSPARAVRDARRGAPPGSWKNDVIVFR
ncbi:MAG: CHAT domain-containing protein [Myxococcales bacterium]|nr:CHAT domain-containing protein [Myxococcales bacterium]